MKVKALLCVTALSMFTMNSFAVELYKGRVINHKEWTTGNIKVTYKNVKKDLSLLNSPLAKSKTKNGEVGVYSELEPATGVTGSPTSFSSDHFVYVSNDSDDTKNYRYIMETCTESGDKTMACAYLLDEVQLDAGGYFTYGAQPSVIVNFDSAGSYRTYAFTQLASEEGRYGSDAIGTITVTDENKKAKG